VAHVDHGIRGRESAADARFVRALGRKLKLPVKTARLQLGTEASEDEARQARLGAFRGMLGKGKNAMHGVVTAHHADDQAETVLMRAMRGTGIEGLAGIAPDADVAGVRLLRPMLAVRRSELHAYLEEIGQGWREDATNASVRYLRNRVRHTVMPMLNVIWPRGVESLGRLAQLAAESNEFQRRVMIQLLQQFPIQEVRGGGVEISRGLLRHTPAAVASEFLRQGIEKAGGSSQSADFERIREALRVARTREGGKRVEVGGGITLHFSGDVVTIRPAAGSGRGR